MVNDITIHERLIWGTSNRKDRSWGKSTP